MKLFSQEGCDQNKFLEFLIAFDITGKQYVARLKFFYSVIIVFDY